VAKKQITQEKRQIGKNLSAVESKRRIAGLKWNKDHRGIHYNKNTGVTIKAKAMTLGDYNQYKSWDMLENEDPTDPGYLVGYSDADGNFNGPLEWGCHHISWSPKDVFEAIYHKGTEDLKTLHNSTVSGARVNVKDIKVVGNGDSFQLLCKASSENEGWMKSTKALQMEHGCLVQVTTQQRNPDGSYAVAEALVYVPGATIKNDINNGRKLVTLKYDE